MFNVDHDLNGSDHTLAFFAQKPMLTSYVGYFFSHHVRIKCISIVPYNDWNTSHG